jgi:predicted protein tyrosine phosphatase
MIEVYDHLWVGNAEDYESNKMRIGWAYVQACKEPYHREALGYTTAAAPKSHPEYLFAERGQRLVLNLVDVGVEKAQYIPESIIDKALTFIRVQIQQGAHVLVHCNQGFSRSPSLALAYLIMYTDMFADAQTFEQAEEKFRTIYPKYSPAGIREKIKVMLP